MEKTKYSFFHKPSKKDDILFRLPKFLINKFEIQREEYLKFLGVLLDQPLRYYAVFKVRKFESLFYKINTCLTTTCIGLQVEQRLSVNIFYMFFFSILGVAFAVPFQFFPEAPASCYKEIFEIIFNALYCYLYELKKCVSDF